MAKEHKTPWNEILHAKPLDEQEILSVRLGNTEDSALENLAYAIRTEKRNASLNNNFDVFVYKVQTGYEAVAASESVLSFYDRICAETKCQGEDNVPKSNVYDWVRQYLEKQKKRKEDPKDKKPKAK
jgi:hypothetical protein